KPANDKVRDVDSDERPYRLRRHEQRLERREETTSHSTGTARMASAAHRASHGCASGDGWHIPESGRDRRATTRRVGTGSTGKTGQRGDHRLRRTASWEPGTPVCESGSVS